jgi:type II secretory pathway component PulF
MLSGVERGQRLSENMKRFPEVFPPLAIAIVAAGEHGGRLDDMLKLMAEYSERDMETQRMLKRETFYPKVLLFAILTIVPFGLAIATGIAQGAAAGLSAAAHTLLLYLVFIGLPIAAIIFAFRLLRKSEQGQTTLDRIRLSLPIFGSLTKHVAMSRFCRALGALYSAGISMPEGVQLASDTLGNAALAEVMSRSIPQLQRGAALSDALAQSNLTPQLVLSMLRTGEQTGNIDSVLLKVADYYDDETKTKTHQLATTIVPICVVIAGIIVLLMAVKFFTGFYGAMLSSQ